MFGNTEEDVSKLALPRSSRKKLIEIEEGEREPSIHLNSLGQGSAIEVSRQTHVQHCSLCRCLLTSINCVMSRNGWSPEPPTVDLECKAWERKGARGNQMSPVRPHGPRIVDMKTTRALSGLAEAHAVLACKSTFEALIITRKSGVSKPLRYSLSALLLWAEMAYFVSRDAKPCSRGF